MKTGIIKTTVTFFLIMFLGSLSSFGFFRIFRPDSIQIVIDSNQLILPGESFKFGIVSYHKKGKIKRTFGMDNGSVFWWNYTVKVAGGNAASGKILVSNKLIPSKGKYIKITAYPNKKPELAKTVLLPLNFETKLAFKPLSPFDKAPGCTVKGEIICQFDNGIQRIYKNLRSNSEAEMFHFSGDGGWWDKGKFVIDPDFLNIRNHRVSLKINALRNPVLETEFEFMLDYKHDYTLAYSGSSGSTGFWGTSGSTGANGCNGGDGGNGGDGQSGDDGPDIGIWADAFYDTLLQTNMLYVYTLNFETNTEKFFLINPEGGSLSVSSVGGSGGNGGNGGNGGDGGSGKDGDRWTEIKKDKRTIQKPITESVKKMVKKTRTNSEGKQEEYEEEIEETVTKYISVEEEYEIRIEHQGPGSNGGNGGDGGNGGLGGYGGYGGNIELFFTGDATRYSGIISAQSIGGTGGSHGYSGSGGRGGSGGTGSPAGNSGFSGNSGLSYPGFASGGGAGRVLVNSTTDFYASH